MQTTTWLHRFTGTGLALAVAGAFALTPACKSKSKPKAEQQTPVKSTDAASDADIVVTYDGTEVTKIPAAKARAGGELREFLPAQYKDASAWAGLIAKSTDGRRVTLFEFSKRFPEAQIRFVVHKGKPLTMAVLRGKKALAQHVVASLTNVTSIHITSLSRQARRKSAEKPITFELSIGGKTQTIDWKTMTTQLKLFRPKGLKKSVYRVRDLLAKHVDIEKVKRIIAHAAARKYEMPASLLTDKTEMASLRLNRRKMVRFRHYRRLAGPGAKTKTGKKPKGKRLYKDLGGLRGLSRLEVLLK